MGSPVTPNDFKNLIPSALASLCDKFVKMFQLPKYFYDWYSYVYDESGEFTDEFKAELCALGCTGDETDNPTNPNMPTPTGVSASDGTYDDKVVVTWNAVTAPTGIDAVTAYKVYRSLSTNENPGSAQLLATVNAPTTTYNDTSAEEGTTYHYWVTATNGTETSAYGGEDVGHRGEATVTLPAISDLRATKGHYYLSSGYVTLAFTPITGATKYDIYRHTSNDFSLATKIASDEEAIDSTTTFGVTAGMLWDNINELAYLDQPPDPATEYYYWVVGKKDSPPATSPESNSAMGFVRIDTGLVGAAISGPMSGTITIPGGITKFRIRFCGHGGDGAGGGNVYGGGGGGGAAVIEADIDCVPGDTFELLGGGTNTHANTAGQTNGNDMGYIYLEKNGVEVLRCLGGNGGDFSGSGSGAGGTGGTTTGSVTYTGYDGADGEAASGSRGGRGGHRFGGFRFPGAHYTGPGSWSSWDGNGASGCGGGGSYPFAPDPTICTAGQGGAMFGIYTYSAS
jgi:fibronectin type 3 domain-containing protein